MTQKKRLIISFCCLIILLNFIFCVFFEGSKISCIANILTMVFTIVGITQNKNGDNQ